VVILLADMEHSLIFPKKLLSLTQNGIHLTSAP